LPPEAARDVATLQNHGTKSNATFPLFADGKVFGALAFGVTGAPHRWTVDEIKSLKIVAELLSHVINRRRAEVRVEQLREEIQRSTRASVLGELAAALAHEINQPLTSMLGNAQAARRFIATKKSDPTEILTILDDIIRDNKRASDVIRNLRSMLTGSPSQRELSCLNELTKEVCSLLSTYLANEGIELQLDLKSSPLRLMLAQVEIRQLLVNLIFNAAHAMSDTPPEQRRIIIETRICGQRVILQIRDHGCGIPPDHLDRIFEPFHTTRANGLGMGLAICRRIAESHGGSLLASNHESGGAIFLFSLPTGDSPR
jgi:C4-dicarboxylate-specific signal transduction histidine kinase